MNVFYVYEIPEKGNYAGYTSNPRRRMTNHKVKSMNLLKAFTTREEAVDYERSLHFSGFSGRRTSWSTKGNGGHKHSEKSRLKMSKAAAGRIPASVNKKGCDPITPRKPITLHGVRYPSLTEASKLTGRSMGYVHKHYERICENQN